MYVCMYYVSMYVCLYIERQTDRQRQRQRDRERHIYFGVFFWGGCFFLQPIRVKKPHFLQGSSDVPYDH